MVEFQLTKNQQQIYDAVEGSNNCILIHGKPGVGKSVLIRALRDTGAKHYTLGAPTGLAALNIGGKTLHALFGITPSAGIITKDYNRFTTNPNVRNNILHSIKHLIMDEISMVRVDVFEYIDRVLRDVKGNDLPFGGIQVVVVGDFFQLPPVVMTADRKALKAEGWENEFAFCSPLFKLFEKHSLDEVLRQKGDDKFIKMLHASRTGDMTAEQLKYLNSRVEPCTDFRIQLTGTNKKADYTNQLHLSKIDGPVKEYHADSYGVWPAFPAETVLSLKVGAQVLVKKNNADKSPQQKEPASGKVVNGSIGIVREISDTIIKVELDCGTVVPIYRARWEQKIREKIGDKWSEKVTASFEQFPLQLAWAISMHKSQGQSFESVHIDPSQIFAAGQLYVALSRSRSHKGLSLESPASKSKFWADKSVVKFVNTIE